MALPLVPATAPVFLTIDVLRIGPAETAAGLVIALGGCHRNEWADLGHVPTFRHGQRPCHFLLQLLDAEITHGMSDVEAKKMLRLIEEEKQPKAV